MQTIDYEVESTEQMVGGFAEACDRIGRTAKAKLMEVVGSKKAPTQFSKQGAPNAILQRLNSKKKSDFRMKQHTINVLQRKKSIKSPSKKVSPVKSPSELNHTSGQFLPAAQILSSKAKTTRRIHSDILPFSETMQNKIVQQIKIPNKITHTGSTQLGTKRSSIKKPAHTLS